MSKISDKLIEKIKEEVLRTLYDSYPEFKYTYQVSEVLLRDDQFILKLLKDMQKTNLVSSFEETEGKNIKRKWSLSNEAYKKYKEILGD